MRVSKMAIRSWKSLCKKYTSVHSDIVREKILRAFTLGQVVHIYSNGNMVARYHDINLLAAGSEIQAVWRDLSIDTIYVSEKVKRQYDESMLFKEE